MDDLFNEMRDKGLVNTWLDEAISRHPDKVEVRLADSVTYKLESWDVAHYQNEKWRWC